jgi:hypothetical protein
VSKTPIDSATFGAGATTALINSGQNFQRIDLWKITLNGGAVIYWHGGAGNKLLNAAGSYTFAAASGQSTQANGTYVLGPPIDRGKITTKLGDGDKGMEAATVDMNITATLFDTQINGTPLIPFVTARGFDGATVVIYRGYLQNWQSQITGVTIAFSGIVTEIKDISRAKFSMTVSSPLVLGNVNMGPDVFQAGCLNTHFDANCGLTAGAFTFGGTVAAGPTAGAFNSNLTNADHYFDKGTVVFTSGVNNGILRTVKTYLSASCNLTFAFAFPATPSAGDTFNAVRGCLLTLADCKAQRTLLDAEEHFRGQPYTPPATQGVL